MYHRRTRTTAAPSRAPSPNPRYAAPVTTDLPGTAASPSNSSIVDSRVEENERQYVEMQRASERLRKYWGTIGGAAQGPSGWGDELRQLPPGDNRAEQSRTNVAAWAVASNPSTVPSELIPNNPLSPVATPEVIAQRREPRVGASVTIAPHAAMLSQARVQQTTANPRRSRPRAPDCCTML